MADSNVQFVAGTAVVDAIATEENHFDFDTPENIILINELRHSSL